MPNAMFPASKETQNTLNVCYENYCSYAHHVIRKETGHRLEKRYIIRSQSPWVSYMGLLRDVNTQPTYNTRRHCMFKSTTTSINDSTFLRLTHVLIIPWLILQGFINQPPVAEFPRQIKDY